MRPTWCILRGTLAPRATSPASLRCHDRNRCDMRHRECLHLAGSSDEGAELWTRPSPASPMLSESRSTSIARFNVNLLSISNFGSGCLPDRCAHAAVSPIAFRTFLKAPEFSPKSGCSAIAASQVRSSVGIVSLKEEKHS